MVRRTQGWKSVAMLLAFASYTWCVNVGVTAVASDHEPARLKKRLVVVKVTRDRDAALSTAAEAARQLGLPLNLRGLSPDADLGLSHTKEFCEARGWGHPCLTSRGWSDDGGYVSVDVNFYYTAFDKGYYIVMVASGMPGNRELRDALRRAKKFYPEAVSKVTIVTAPGIWR